VSPATVDARNPFAGLQSFGEADRGLFRGRESEAQELFRLVRREVLTVLFGRSGLGKTSLLRAGLFPLLREAGFLPVPIRLDFTPGGSLAGRIKVQIDEALGREAVDAAPPDANETLWEYFHRARWWNAANRLLHPVLVFDQLEEIFTLGRGDARVAPLLTELADLIENQIPISVRERLAAGEELPFSYEKHTARLIFSLREDFLAQLEDLRPQIPSIVRSRFRLIQMTGAQARRAVVEPAAGLVSEAVAGEILRFVAGHGQETGADETVELDQLEIEPALLSLFCRELNDRRLAEEGAAITSELVRSSQGKIVADFYERSVAGLGPAVRTFIEDRLLTASGFRHSEPLEEALRLPGVAEEELRLLVDRRVLRLEPRLGHLHIELIHDLLTRVVRESRDRRQTRERWRRQMRRLAAAAACLATLFVASGWIALRQRALKRSAVRQQARAQVVLNYMLFDLDQNLPALGDLSLTEGVQNAALRYVEAHSGEGESAAAAAQRAAAYRNLASIYFQQGKLEKAEHFYRRGLAISDPFMNSGNASPELQDTVGRLHRGLGVTRSRAGDSRGAFAETWAACQLFRQLTARQPENPEWQADLSACRAILSDLFISLGRLEPAFEQENANLELMRKLAARNPGNPRWRAAVADRHIALGDLFTAKGDPKRARAEFFEALALDQQLAAENPSDTDRQTSLSVVADRLAIGFKGKGDLRQARRYYLDSFHIDQKLAEQDSSNVTWRENLAISYANLGDIALLEKDLATARNFFEKSLAIRKRLSQASPTDTHLQWGLASAYWNIGDLLIEQGALREASSMYQKSALIFSALAAQDPANATWLSNLADVQQKEGTARLKLGDRPRAAELYGEARRIYQELIRRDPRNLDSYDSLAMVDQVEGNALLAHHNPRGALERYEATVHAYQALVAKDPKNPEWSNGLSWAYVSSGRAYEALGERRKAREQWRRAVEIMAPILETTQGSAMLDTQAQALLLLDRIEEARPIVERLLARNWNDPDFLALVRKAGLLRRGRP
jgi:tetratricopeptide (TPR) repeat protein